LYFIIFSVVSSNLTYSGPIFGLENIIFTISGGVASAFVYALLTFFWKKPTLRLAREEVTFDKHDVKGLPFYDWQQSKAQPSPMMSFNHAIGLPEKNGIPMPLFDYEQLLYNELQSNKHLWIKKATGLGVTEFMLRYMAWLCLSCGQPEGSQMCIVTGPRIELAITLIDRLRALFLQKSNVIFDSKETVVDLNECHKEAYPSHHLDSMRGLADVSFIYLDEADFSPCTNLPSPKAMYQSQYSRGE
jgi:hypothetical protein